MLNRVLCGSLVAKTGQPLLAKKTSKVMLNPVLCGSLVAKTGQPLLAKKTSQVLVKQSYLSTILYQMDDDDDLLNLTVNPHIQKYCWPMSSVLN